ncbi:unnamed protein product [Schistocephalus solidus]|uniref:Cytochrome b561 domain-containing protein n=1 Tax=Schistocephalus solidus TaxID=70667 RepID=A0A183TE07_SCHSO|nr:unnamed protein product [Schistocephalus solidus]
MEAFSMQESPAISIVGLLAVILVFVWIQSYDDGFPNQLVFDYHPPFMVLGMIFCFGESLLVYRVFPGCAKIGLKILHAVLLVASLVIGAVGMRAAYNPGKGTPYSLHSWIGIIAFTLYGLQVLEDFLRMNLRFFESRRELFIQNILDSVWLIGFIVFLLPRISAKVRTKLLPTHVAVGVIIFVFTIVAVLTGINEKNFFPGDYAALPPAARVGNAVGLLVISFGSLVIYLLYRNDYARKESPPLT